MGEVSLIEFCLEGKLCVNLRTAKRWPEGSWTLRSWGPVKHFWPCRLAPTNSKHNGEWLVSDEGIQLAQEGEGILPKQSGDYGFASQAGEVISCEIFGQIQLVKIHRWTWALPETKLPTFVAAYPTIDALMDWQAKNNHMKIISFFVALLSIWDKHFCIPTRNDRCPWAWRIPSGHTRSWGPWIHVWIYGNENCVLNWECHREENIRVSSEFTPWYSGQNKFASQKGTGGFLKVGAWFHPSRCIPWFALQVRDVLPHTTGGKEIPEDSRLKSEGIVPLQVSGFGRIVLFWTLRCFPFLVWHQQIGLTKGNDRIWDTAEHDDQNGMEEGMVGKGRSWPTKQ